MSPATAAPLVRGWEVVIGLETHAQLSTQSKIFSGASTRFGAAANTQACAVDLALPGTLPVMSRGAVERAIRFGLAVQATVAPLSIFARKNYFYPDLPKGYQISQYEIPVVQGGTLSIAVAPKGGAPYAKTVRLTRAHLEEDAGKSLHEGMGSHAALGHGMSGIDLNRAGTPLLEIVSEPDRALHRTLVEHRQHAGQRQIDHTGLRVGRRPEGSAGAGEDLARGGELRVGLEADHDFPGHRALLRSRPARAGASRWPAGSGAPHSASAPPAGNCRSAACPPACRPRQNPPAGLSPAGRPARPAG